MHKFADIIELLFFQEKFATQDRCIFLGNIDWEVVQFRPDIFAGKDKFRYKFRIYGRVSGSIFPEQNRNLKYLADLIYYIDPDKSVKWEVIQSQIHEKLIIEIDLENVINILRTILEGGASQTNFMVKTSEH